MIGHYLLALTEEQEDRVLTEKLAYAPALVTADGCRCLLGVTGDYGNQWKARYPSPRLTSWFPGDDGLQALCVGRRFDKLVMRFGITRINAAIRNRILSNRSRRVLQPVPAGAERA